MPVQLATHSRVSVILLAVFSVACWLSGTATAQTEIHKCTDADGGIVYSQLPCAPEKPAGNDTAEQEEPTQALEPDTFTYELRATESEVQEPKSAEEVAACKKRYRDAIDVIDAEIGRDYSNDQADNYKLRLLELTRQLRQC